MPSSENRQLQLQNESSKTSATAALREARAAGKLKPQLRDTIEAAAVIMPMGGPYSNKCSASSTRDRLGHGRAISGKRGRSGRSRNAGTAPKKNRSTRINKHTKRRGDPPGRAAGGSRAPTELLTDLKQSKENKEADGEAAKRGRPLLTNVVGAATPSPTWKAKSDGGER